MKYVHRTCLDEWRVQSMNPKSLVQCTTCGAKYRINYQSAEGTLLPWWLLLLGNIGWYLGLRALIFFGGAFVMGFMSPVGHLHSNPAINHLLGGTGITLAMVGGSGLLYVVWHLPFSGNHRFLSDLCPKRSGNKDGLKALTTLLIIAGACVVLWFLLKGIYRLVCEARRELVGAARDVNAQARRELVQKYVVMDLAERA